LWAPPPELTVSEWADAERKLSSESAAEPGRYRTSRTEYARGIMDAFNDPAVKDVVVMSSSQVAKTTILENVVGYFIHHDPSPMMIIFPTLDMAESFSKDRLAPMIRDTSVLHARVAEAGSRRGDNKILHKKFPGGHLTISGSNSPSSLASRPIRILLGDEVDRYEASAGTEGDPIRLATKRTTAFWNAKRGWFSTPGLAGVSRIERLYDQSDRRRFLVPCPHCSLEHEILWDGLKWTEGKPIIAADGARIRSATDAWFECPGCFQRIDDTDRWRSIKQGYWQATAPFTGIAGFWLWQGYSPFKTALDTANEWLSALGRPEEEKTVKNTVRGETWQQAGEAPDWEKLWLRAQASVKPEKLPFWKIEIPGANPEDPKRIESRGVLFLTMGIDVQQDRVEFQIVGWGRGKRSWLIHYDVIPGKSADLSNPDSDLARRLDAELDRSYVHETGLNLQVSKAAIDSGYATQDVYTWARRHPGRVIVVKGYDSGVALLGIPQAADILASGKVARRAVKVWPMNVSKAKEELYGWLRMSVAGEGEDTAPGWCEFYDAGREFFEQITAEQWVIRYVKGFASGSWEKRRERNEALDTRNLARGAAENVGISRWQDQQWEALEDQFRDAQPIAHLPAVAQAPPPKQPEPARPAAQQSAPTQYWNRRPSFWNR